LFGLELVYSTSDLGKILGKFNSPIQGRKLIIMNETGMASGEWHKGNDHLKSLITEDYVSIERKGLEFQESKLLEPKQDTNMYSALSVENRIIKKQLEDYHTQHNTLER
ncbi:11531_t:CDS:2, partial [Funneliformis geosporum]